MEQPTITYIQISISSPAIYLPIKENEFWILNLGRFELKSGDLDVLYDKYNIKLEEICMEYTSETNKCKVIEPFQI